MMALPSRKQVIKQLWSHIWPWLVMAGMMWILTQGALHGAAKTQAYRDSVSRVNQEVAE